MAWEKRNAAGKGDMRLLATIVRNAITWGDSVTAQGKPVPVEGKWKEEQVTNLVTWLTKHPKAEAELRGDFATVLQKCHTNRKTAKLNI